MWQFAPVAEFVDRCGRDVQQLGDLAHCEQVVGTSRNHAEARGHIGDKSLAKACYSLGSLDRGGAFNLMIYNGLRSVATR